MTENGFLAWADVNGRGKEEESEDGNLCLDLLNLRCPGTYTQGTSGVSVLTSAEHLSWRHKTEQNRPTYSILFSAAAAAKSLQSCPTLCDSIDGSPPGFTVPGILQARTLEWVAISFSNA